MASVIDARVLKSIPLLDQAAIDAVMQWTFTPTLLNGNPVQVDHDRYGELHARSEARPGLKAGPRRLHVEHSDHGPVVAGADLALDDAALDLRV